MKMKGFGTEDFAKFHPGGALGKKLYLHVSDLYVNNEVPRVFAHSTLKEVIIEISRKRLGVTAVVDPQDVLLGIITDGDLRRMLEYHPSLQGVEAFSIMTQNPQTIEADQLAVEALDLMRKKDISQLVVVKGKTYKGIVHLHDLIREGLI
jgi:arabinose-5-phosphate isomerase